MDGTRYSHTDGAAVLTRSDGMPVDYVPNANRIVRVAPNSWDRMLRHTCVGIAPGTENESDGTPTVLCYNMFRPDIPVVRTVRSFRPERAPRQTRAQQTQQDSRISAYERLGSLVGFATELAGE